MTTFALKLAAARNSQAWQLALDKFPFDVQRTNRPWLTRPNDEQQQQQQQEQSIKPHRLREIKDRAAAASGEWKTAIDSRLAFVDTLERQYASRFRCVTLINSSRLLLHLGRASVLENVGLYADRTTGLPLIPGTAVKGVVSTWAAWEGNQTRSEFSSARSDLDSWVAKVLGTNPDKDHPGDHIAGAITFIGGIPSNVPKLELDIVTPHPDDGKGHITPNPFLAVAPGTFWHFPLIASPRLKEDEATAMLNKAATWLEEVLTQLGLGAKTAAGYGGFRLLTEAEKAKETTRSTERHRANETAAALAANQQRIATLSPEEKAYEDFITSITDWTAAARDILKTEEPQRGYILRHLRTATGQAIIKAWPNNDKAKHRKANLKEAGL